MGWTPEEFMRTLLVIDTHGLGYAHHQASEDPVISRHSDSTVGHMS